MSIIPASYLGNRAGKSRFRPAWAKKLVTPYLKNKINTASHVYNINYMGGVGRGLWSKAIPEEEQEILYEK
jgi:hypothetical protein